jgi:hypothetical protein
LLDGASADCVHCVVEIRGQKYRIWVSFKSCFEGPANDGWTTLDSIRMLEWSAEYACTFNHGKGTATGYAVQGLSDGNQRNRSRGLAKPNAIAIKQIV